ncbi:Hypothetical predicted protein [Podarcis lilfordi]|uniref:Uncharacterized protein n=1 Tax=Podarcis lilfordi TaxID=74358 RepID=A0AA35L628_9SAUR|nr:Hypothetical predicted protein [Podarcis lilfordi]
MMRIPFVVALFIPIYTHVQRKAKLHTQLPIKEAFLVFLSVCVSISQHQDRNANSEGIAHILNCSYWQCASACICHKQSDVAKNLTISKNGRDMISVLAGQFLPNSASIDRLPHNTILCPLIFSHLRWQGAREVESLRILIMMRAHPASI